jgi:6-pyruvoyltetrahydropterin/6-carboxytetrahydropterin synthase
MVAFAPIKAALAKLCADFKEHVLLAKDNPHMRIASDDGTSLEFTLCGERYVLPCKDVLLLDVDNISVESLSVYVAEHLRAQLRTALEPHATALEVTIEESPGQGATTTLALP